MFEYFPGNYVWNLGVVATLNSSGLIDEVDRACRPPALTRLPVRTEVDMRNGGRCTVVLRPPFREWLSGGVLLSHPVPRAVPSALKGLASGFGMRPGVSLSP